MQNTGAQNVFGQSTHESVIRNTAYCKSSSSLLEGKKKKQDFSMTKSLRHCNQIDHAFSQSFLYSLTKKDKLFIGLVKIIWLCILLSKDLQQSKYLAYDCCNSQMVKVKYIYYYY